MKKQNKTQENNGDDDEDVNGDATTAAATDTALTATEHENFAVDDN